MLIRRCAWHREFHGYTLVHGVAAWRGFSVKFTDGVCRSCAARVRIEWRIAGRHAEAHPAWISSRVPAGFRRAALTAGIVLVVATALPVTLISDRRLGPLPGEYPVGEEGAVEVVGLTTPARRPHALMSGEAAPPRVWRQRPGPVATPRARQSRRQMVKGTLPSASPVPTLTATLAPTAPVLMSLGEPAPGEGQPTDPHEIQVASVAPSLGRAHATEDEFSRRVRRASITRLSLSPPPERPRHAGLTIQGP